MTPNQIKYRIHKLYQFLEHGHTFDLRRMRVYRGYIHTHDFPTVVTLDYTDRIIPTLIHEFLHYLHPTWSETKILKAESAIICQLTERQIRNILKRLANVL
jgi:hypothetical protein